MVRFRKNVNREQMNINFSNWVSKILKLCFLLFSCLVTLGILTYCFLLYQIRGLKSSVVLIFCMICVFLAIAFACYILAIIPESERNNIIVLSILLIVFVLISCLWIYKTPMQQTSDYETFWQTTLKALKGKAIYQTDNNYFAKWAYQTGFLTYLMLVVKFLGTHIRILQLLNIFYQVIILILLYCITKRLWQKIIFCRWCVFLMAINMEWFCLNNRLSNQYIAMMFFLASLYLIMCNYSIKTWLLAGIFLAIGNFLRPIGVIYLAGIIVFEVIYSIIGDLKNGKQNFLRLLTFILTYFLLLTGFGLAVKATGLNEYGLSNRDSLWKLVTGLNYQSAGTYRKFIDEKFNLTESRVEMAQREEEVTKENVQYLNHNHLWLKLFIRKFNCLWSYPSNSLNYALSRKNCGYLTYYLLLILAYSINAVEMIFMLIGAFSLVTKKLPDKAYLLILILFAYVAAQLIIEVQGRYRIEFTPILIIYSLFGIQTVLQKFEKKEVQL